MSEKKPVEVLSTINLNDAQINRIRAVEKSVHLTVYSQKALDEIPAEQWQKCEVLLTSGRGLPKPEQAPNLKWIQLTFAGVDPIIENPIVRQPGVRLTSASGVMVSQMGEYTLMALLMLGHKIPEVIQAQKEARWGNNMSKPLQPKELRGSTVGIVGYGSIGREVARLLYPLGATVLAAKRDVMAVEDSGYTPAGLGDPLGNYFRRLYPIEGLKGMLQECDFVVISLPLTSDTRFLFSTEMFDAMKPGAFLVNVSRGDLIDEAALIQAVHQGKVGGAVLDVFSQEPLPAESPLWKVPEIIVTPHISGASTHLLDDVVDLFAENLRHYLAGEPLYNLVDPQKGY